ncbi:HAD family hydrolase [Acaryochloris marina]|uniref:HAD-superfamily hydrolase, subfamily IA, variant 1, putative n=1 Tax=Acaryochloris marina (strain MBIC 11017) TaxID=329726 RepID=B0CFK1_ACAM1|nr:HAD family hydrolase [Acaryochloris marina]ABW27020.1 HAD-superfamily hydrolase, subfamily IA, variant 1, putative [Acaryochloris marina MBIC11017]BDM81785.1 noncanonical pyrimidine nucleotidase, YjjG family protein [Acaryochloris marina MBIC10699]
MAAHDLDKIKVISFDGDMTLWDFEKVMRHSLALTLQELKRHVPDRASAQLTIDKMIDIRKTVAAELKGTTVNLEQIRLKAFQRTLEFIHWDDPALAAALNQLYLKHRFEAIELYSDVIPCLDVLKDRFAIGLISNGNSYPERCGLSGYFDFVIFSQDIGVEKPQAEIFLSACAQAGCAPEQLMHIGDSLDSDVVGANGVGAISVWLNRNDEENTSHAIPTYEIRSLLEMTQIFER